jgi:hypothetical protein
MSLWISICGSLSRRQPLPGPQRHSAQQSVGRGQPQAVPASLTGHCYQPREASYERREVIHAPGPIQMNAFGSGPPDSGRGLRHACTAAQWGLRSDSSHSQRGRRAGGGVSQGDPPPPASGSSAPFSVLLHRAAPMDDRLVSSYGTSSCRSDKDNDLRDVC